jgi:D-glycero-D-manno-heptose 1,7-bisphosphate phosphatase
MIYDSCRAVFLDRDGVINHDAEYIDRPDRFDVYPWSGPAIVRLNRMGFRVFVVTNQSGVARGLFTLDDVASIHEKMLGQLSEHGAHVDDIFISPYFATGTIAPYNVAHEDRKPGLGMYYAACRKWGVRSRGSYMIGDRGGDIEFGAKAGLRPILVLSGLGRQEFLDKRASWTYRPDFVTGNLESASRLIERLEASR